VPDYSQGDIVLVPFPFTNLEGSKVRPAIIVSNHHLNSNSNDVILVQCTTSENIRNNFLFKVHNSDVTIPFIAPRTYQNVVCHKIAVIEKNLIHKTISRVKPHVLELLLDKVKKFVQYIP